MHDQTLRRHFLVTLAVLIGAWTLLNASGHRRKTPLLNPLGTLPLVIGDWQGVNSALPQRIVAASGVDDYLNRSYTDPLGHQAGLYIGYYDDQRSGDQIHSPRNCLPAGGWETVRAGRLDVTAPTFRFPIEVNEFIISKGLQRDLILYWYLERGRAIPDEYMAKFWMVADALIRNRTDGALVRVAVPVQDRDADARLQAVRFVKSLYPYLEKIVPK